MADHPRHRGGPERRRDLRVAWRRTVCCTSLGDSEERSEAEAENVSAGGALLVKPRRLAIGDAVVLDLREPQPPLCERRPGRVVRDCGDVGDGRHRYAVRFEPLSRQGRAEMTAALIVAASEHGHQLR